MPHNCKLFVSFNAPHLGANIPIGDQLFLSFTATTLEDPFAKQVFDEKLNNPAAKQLLTVHHLGFSGSNTSINQGAPNFRERFKQAMTTIGWPAQTRNIGIANGSINGTTTGSAGMNVADLQYVFRSDAWRFFFGRSGLINRIYFTNGYGTRSDIFYYFRRTWFLSSNRQTVSAAFNSVCSIDAAPGGTFDTQGQIGDGLPRNPKIQGFKVMLQTNNLFRNHCFIPTISALALTNNNPDFCQSLYSRNLVCANETPFKTYYAPVGKNMKHVSFDNELGTWLKNEFKGVPQPPTLNYNAAYPISIVTGTEPICSPVTYKVNNLPTGASVVWSVDNQNIATVNSSTGTVTGKATGTVILTATITACGSTFPTKRSIQVGVPTVNISYSQSDACNGSYQTWYLNATSPNAITSWQWTVDNPSSGSWNINSPNSPNTYVSVSGGGGISVTATSSCGTTKTGVTIYSNCGFGITASPNPTTDNVTVAAAEPKDVHTANKKKAMMYQIKVTDQVGNVKKQYKYSRC
ncbi:MAG: Ig-like domain-containing protein [Segetibacter sp.]